MIWSFMAIAAAGTLSSGEMSIAATKNQLDLPR
jgi:hypothetical protein